MAYKIDFTAADYARRALRKLLLRLLLLAALGAAAWGVYDVYRTYNEPTLDMRLAEYEAVALRVEEMNQKWDEAEKEFNTILPYYRLVWADSPTNFLNRTVSPNAPSLGNGFRPVRWMLKTGGECRLDYVYVFKPDDKAAQAKGIEGAVINVVTSMVSAVTNSEGKAVFVEGVKLENLLNERELDITARFTLKGVKEFPPKEKKLADCAAEIDAFRKKIQSLDVPNAGVAAGASQKVNAMMLDYLSVTHKDKEGYPQVTNVINVAGWFDDANRFIRDHKDISVNAGVTNRLRQAWKKFGSARYPWERYRVLDNEELSARAKELGRVSDGVSRFKDILVNRHADYIKKINPLVEVYNRNDVFNKPLIEMDLKGRAAQSAGISSLANVAFKDDADSEGAVLSKGDETFTFTWVRWTLAFDAAKRSMEQGATNSFVHETLTLDKIADCASKIATNGAGYAIDSVRIEFNQRGDVSEAVLDGLLPVKKVKSKGEGKKEDKDSQEESENGNK